jgi:acyl carrier protein
MPVSSARLDAATRLCCDARVSKTLTSLIELCARRFNRNPQDLNPAADVFESLGVDSMQVLSLLTELEQEFNVEIPDYELREVRTFEQLAACIEQRL